MVENPYSSPGIKAETQVNSGMSTWGLLLEISKYLGAYLLGIVAAISFTPVEMNLGHVPLWISYPILAPIGFFLFYLYLEGAYLPFGGKGTAYWFYFSIGLVPVLMELLSYLMGAPRLRSWRPLWLGFPIGFVGTMGVYYTAAASI